MRLDEAIVKHLDATERAALAAALGVEWAELPGEKAGARAAALVTALGEAGRAAELIAALAEIRPQVPWAALPYPRDTLNHLHETLTRRHNLDGLRSLCFRLGLDYDDLPGEGKSGRARELVLALDRQGRAAELWTRSEVRVTSEELRAATPAVRRGGRFRKTTQRASSVIRSLWPAVSGQAAGLASGRRAAAGILLVLFLMALVMGRRGLAPDSTPSAALEKNYPSRAAATQQTSDGSPAAIQSSADFPATPAPARSAVTPAATTAVVGVTAASPATAPPASPTAARPLLEVGYRGANLRRGPGPQFEIVATLRAGALLEAHGLSPSGEWIQVRYPGRGWPWIDAGYATLPAGATLPVISLVASATAAYAPEPPTPSPIATGAPAGPPYYGLPPTASPSPTRPPRPTTPPYYWTTPTSPPP